MFDAMMGFLRWLWRIVKSVLDSFAKVAVFAIFVGLLLTAVSLFSGDGLSRNMVLTLDLRHSMEDSSGSSLLGMASQRLSILDVVMGLDSAARDTRVKGVYLRVGSGNLSVAQAEELRDAMKRFRAAGKFITAHSQSFYSNGLGDYVVAAQADSVWMQPVGTFFPAGASTETLFLKGLFDKVHAVPQFAQRYEYKNAANVYTQTDYTPPHREATTRVLQSWYDSATLEAATDRKLDRADLTSFLDTSPASSEEVKAKGLITDLGYDDDASKAALAKAGKDAKLVPFAQFLRAKRPSQNAGDRPTIALVHAAGEIVEGGGDESPLSSGPGKVDGDRFARAIRSATENKDIKAILLRVDSPGGSAIASDQILDALKKAHAAGKPIVVSMGSVAASGGYYIAMAADKIIAEPGTLTGSIGVLWGKFAIAKSLEMAGLDGREIGIGKNALFLSSMEPWTKEQMAEVDAQADAVYADFTQKVAAGRKMPLEQVQAVARGRVWTGADAKERGLVDELGGFWTAVNAAKVLAKIDAGTQVRFRKYPAAPNWLGQVTDFFETSSATIEAVRGLAILMNTQAVQSLVNAVESSPSGRAELKAADLPAH